MAVSSASEPDRTCVSRHTAPGLPIFGQDSIINPMKRLIR
jgi:hypothetical protein